MAKFNLPFANAGEHRYPTPDEQAQGFPCGPVDRELFNGMFNRLESELGNAILYSGQVASDGDLSQITKAIRRGSWSYAVASGTANVLTASLTPALEAYTPGLVLSIRIATTNTGAATINVDGLGAKPVKRLGGGVLQQGDLAAGAIAILAYDGTQFQIVSTPASVREATAYGIGGTYTFIVPAGVLRIRIKAWGAGGSGGGATVANAAGSGAGGGGYAEGWIDVQPGDVLTIIVGTGGAAVAGAVNGNAGGTSSVGPSISATGGGGGYYSGGGIQTTVGTAGQGYGGYLRLTGQSGGQSEGIGGAIRPGFGGAAAMGGAGGPSGGLQSGAGGSPGGGGGGSTNGYISATGADGLVILEY